MPFGITSELLDDVLSVGANYRNSMHQDILDVLNSSAERSHTLLHVSYVQFLTVTVSSFDSCSIDERLLCSERNGRSEPQQPLPCSGYWQRPEAQIQYECLCHYHMPGAVRVSVIRVSLRIFDSFRQPFAHLQRSEPWRRDAFL